MPTTKPLPPIDGLEPRMLLNAAFDYIGLTALRNDPVYSGLDGTGVTVAILDTGLDRTHTLLAPGYKAGKDVITGSDNPIDREDHGTHVAGIIGARDSEIGAAPDVGLVGVKVLGDDGRSTASSVVDGLRWVYDNRTRYNIQVVNMSLGGGFYTSANQLAGDDELQEVRRLEAAGITVVSAGGNSFKGHEYQNFAAPGIFSTLVVGAQWKDGTSSNVEWGSGAIDYTTGVGRITSFSQRLVASNTIFAPGAMIRSTVPGNGFDTMAGTSQASPLVAGCVAVLQEAAQRFGGRFLSPTEVRDIIISTGQTINDGDDENDNVQNTGANYKRLDVYAAVQEVQRRLAGTNNGGGGGGTDTTDANGTIAGAFLVNPALDGSQTLTASGRIGVDPGSSSIGAVDVDMFKVEMASSGTLIVTLSTNTADPADFDSYLRLFNSSGQEIAADDDGVAANGFSKITKAGLASGVYYVGVSGVNNQSYDPAGGGRTAASSTGSYTVSFALSNSDPNGLLSGAVSVSFGTDRAPANFSGLIGADYGSPVGTADVDMFKVIVPDDGTLLINIDTPDATGFVDTFLRLFNESGAALASSDDDLAQDAAGNFVEQRSGDLVINTISGNVVGHFTDSFISIRVTRGTTYYFGVSDYQNSTYNPANLDSRRDTGPGGTYELTFQFVSTDVNGSIPLAAAGRTLPFEFATGQIGTDTDSLGGSVTVGDKDVDFIRVVVSSASLVEFDVDSTMDYDANTDPFDSYLTLYNSSGTQIATNDDFRGLDPTIQIVLNPGTYYIAVAGYGNDGFDPFATGSGTPGETGTYRLSVRLFNKSTVSQVADDAIGFADIAALPIGASVHADLGTDSGFASGPSDVDLYRYTATGDGLLAVTTEGREAFSADTFLRIFDSSGKELAYNDNASADTRSSFASVPVKRGKVYYIGVSGAGDNPRAYTPKTYGRAAAGSTGAYYITGSFNSAPSLTAVSTLTGADAGLPFTITYDSLAAAANESDPDADAISFVVTKITAGSLTKNGAAIVPGVTTLSSGESLVWTPTTKASGATKAFTILAADAALRSLKPVQVSALVNAAPTLTKVKDLAFPAPAPGTNPPVTITYESLLSAANEADKNKDPIRFRIASVLAGSLTQNGVAITPGDSLLGPGQSLVYQAPSTGLVSAFTIRAFDGRLNSATSITVRVKIGR